MKISNRRMDRPLNTNVPPFISWQVTCPKDESKRAVNSAAYKTLTVWDADSCDLDDQIKVDKLKDTFKQLKLTHKIENVDLTICTKRISHWSLQQDNVKHAKRSISC